MITPTFNNLSAEYLMGSSSVQIGMKNNDNKSSGKRYNNCYQLYSSVSKVTLLEYFEEEETIIWETSNEEIYENHYCQANIDSSWIGFHEAKMNTIIVGIEIIKKDNRRFQPVLNKNLY
jgi:hypothetical protein